MHHHDYIMTTFGVADTVFDRFELRRSGVVRWCTPSSAA